MRTLYLQAYQNASDTVSTMASDFACSRFPDKLEKRLRPMYTVILYTSVNANQTYLAREVDTSPPVSIYFLIARLENKLLIF